MMNIPALIIAACFAIPACTLLATFLVRPEEDRVQTKQPAERGLNTNTHNGSIA